MKLPELDQTEWIAVMVIVIVALIISLAIWKVLQ